MKDASTKGYKEKSKMKLSHEIPSSNAEEEADSN
jgi:hypothetical protein